MGAEYRYYYAPKGAGTTFVELLMPMLSFACDRSAYTMKLVIDSWPVLVDSALRHLVPSASQTAVDVCLVLVFVVMVFVMVFITLVCVPWAIGSFGEACRFLVQCTQQVLTAPVSVREPILPQSPALQLLLLPAETQPLLRCRTTETPRPSPLLLLGATARSDAPPPPPSGKPPKCKYPLKTGKLCRKDRSSCPHHKHLWAAPLE